LGAEVLTEKNSVCLEISKFGEQPEAHLSSSHGDLDLAMWSWSLGSADLAIWTLEFDSVDFTNL